MSHDQFVIACCIEYNISWTISLALPSLHLRVKSAAEAFSKLVITLSFVVTKQPLRIAQVLRQVYPVDPSNVDEELVER